MEAMISILTVVALMVLAAALGHLLGYVLTETRARIPLEFKPFNCRPCLTFWLTLGLSGGVAVLMRSQVCDQAQVAIYVCAILLAFLNFFIVKTFYKIID